MKAIILTVKQKEKESEIRKNGKGIRSRVLNMKKNETKTGQEREALHIESI